MARLFFALAIPQSTKDIIESIQAHQHFSGKPINPHNFHMTLKFLGEILDAQCDELIDTVAPPNIKPFQIEFGTLAYFAKAKLGCLEPKEVPAELLALVAHIEKSIKHCHLRLKKSHKAYRPHITLYRQADITSSLEKVYDVTLEVTHFYLMESVFNKKGVYYKEVAQWPLYQPSLKEQILGIES